MLLHLEQRGVDADHRHPVALATTEAVTNVVVHAYRDARGPGMVDVRVQFDGDSVLVVVEDEGCGMSPRLDSPGIGLGLPLIARLADAVDVGLRADRPGTRVAMSFAPPERAHEAEA